MRLPSAAPIEITTGWRAELVLGFESNGERTVLAHRRHVGPLIVQRPFYPEGSVCHSYIVHPPGGVVGGDQLALRADVSEGAHALVTTPAATKFYRAAATREARVVQELRVRAGTCEWLPQESIFFDGANVDLTTRVQLDEQSRFIGWEVGCYGRPASADWFRAGYVRQRFELWLDERPLLLDRLRVTGNDSMMSAPWGLAGNHVIGTLLAFPSNKDDLDAARAVLGAEPLFSCTLVDRVLVCRALAQDTGLVRQCLTRIWQQLRPRLLGREAIAPRIWAT
jgi:urease accessory protein